jgi:DNA-binding transcriptional ArsR family regulator
MAGPADDDDAVFKALADGGRRRLLDALYAEDGQTLGALCRHLPEMSRFGVMKHLGVLEQAGLVVTHRSGRVKHHYLNPVPIRELHDRWITKYAQPVTTAMVGLRRQLEDHTA